MPIPHFSLHYASKHRLCICTSLLKQTKGLNYRHTDNINIYINAMRNIGVPEVYILTELPSGSIRVSTLLM
jgi:hypothetical protein